MSAPYELDDDNVFVVIGSGAGGETLANELAQKGIDVVCLEAGSRLAASEIINDPPEMDKRMGWHDPREGAPTWLCKTVGGTTMRWSAVSLRMKDYEFRPLSEYGKIDGTSLIDWPLTYEELAPYYAKAESKMGVSGTGDIPPSDETNNYKVLKAGGRLSGYKEITSSHMAINPVARDDRAGCQQLGFCYSGCAFQAKWSTLYTEIPKAEATSHFELRPKSMVVEILHDDSGKVTSVVYQDEKGVRHKQKARGVAIAGNVVETTRLLLNNSSSRFPNGLANSSGHVGRNYMKHQHGSLAAVMPGPVNAHRGARQTGLIFDEWKHEPSRGFAGGYTIQATFGDPAFMATIFGGWGQELTDFVMQYDHIALGFACGEDMPNYDNRIELDPTKTDDYGLPVPVLTYSQQANAKALEEHSMAAMAKIYTSLGGDNIKRTHGNVSSCHNMGVARMSANPEDGVTNKWGQSHDIPNLFISDGSVFSSSGAANPTLTIVALAIRQADHIAQRMAQGSL